MTLQPLTSVLLSVYNGERFLSEAIESVLNQSLENFEFIIVDDGSTDSTPAILARFAKMDSRLHLERNSKNLGISASRNRCIALAKSDLIAWMDADDICARRRLELQLEFLDAHPDIAILGSAVELIDDQGRALGVLDYPLSPSAVQWKSFVSAPFNQPAVMLRKSLLTLHQLSYQEEYTSGEDGDLWTRLLPKTRGANLKQPLLRYRVHASSLTSVADKTAVRKLRVREKIKQVRARFPDIKLTDEDLAVLYNGFRRDPAAIQGQRARSALHYLVLWQAFKQTLISSAEQQELQREVVSTAAKFAFYPPFQPESWAAMKALFDIDRAWPFVLVLQAPKLIYQRALSLRSKRLRKQVS